MPTLNPDEFNQTFEQILGLKTLIRHCLDPAKFDNPWDIQEQYAKVQATIYRKWSQIHTSLLASDSLATQFFSIFDLASYCHNRCKLKHQQPVALVPTALDPKTTIEELTKALSRVANGVQELDPDCTLEELEYLTPEVEQLRALISLCHRATQTLDSYLDARLGAEYRATTFQREQGTGRRDGRMEG
jgi:hypothetical protein